MQLLEIWKSEFYFCKHWHVVCVKIVVDSGYGFEKNVMGNCADK